MRFRRCAVWSGLVLAGLTAGAVADVTRARGQLLVGDYRGATSALAGDKAIEAQLLSARLARETGQWAVAAQLMTPLVRDTALPVAQRERAQVEWGRALLALGRGVEVAAAQVVGHGSRGIVIRAQLITGLGTKAQVHIDELLRANRARTLDFNDPQALWSLGVAARAARKTELANDAFSEAAKLAPEDPDFALERAVLFADKFSAANAARVLADVLQRNPHHAAAHGLRALVIVESTYDVAEARSAVAAALAVDPTEASALLVRGLIALDDNDWPTVATSVTTLRARSPSEPNAGALAAAAAWIRDDEASYQAARAAYDAATPGAPVLLRTLQRAAQREHRYADGVTLGHAALARDPADADAMGDVGLGYLRLGQEKAGLEWLEKAHAADGYNTRVFNTLTLFDETIPQQYTTFSTKSFRFRVHKNFATVARLVLVPFMEAAFADMTKRYGYQPPTPVTIELYDDADDYAVRTVGMPQLAALGVCFGQVITALSPAGGNINWGMVLYHELAHVFAIGLSNSRVPRWYTEGLSEVETMRARAEWQRENDMELAAAMRAGKLPGILALSKEFTQGDVTVAYYLSAVVMEYLVNQYGYPKVVAGLRAFAAGGDSEAVIRTVTGADAAAFDRAFLAVLAERLRPMQRTYFLPRLEASTAELQAAAESVKSKPDDWAHLSLRLAQEGEAPAVALAWAHKAVAADAKHVLGRYLIALGAARMDDPAAESLLSRLVASGVDNEDIRAALATARVEANDLRGALAHWCAAKSMGPDRSRPYAESAELYQQLGDEAARRRELAHYAVLEQMQVGPPKTLALAALQTQTWRDVERFAELALFITPTDTEVLLARGQAQGEIGQHQAAVLSYDTALAVVTPETWRLRRPALAHLGRAKALWALGQKRQARAALADAAALEPEHPDVAALGQAWR